MNFLNENDYRDLKQVRHVFRADMGAEAFHEILKGMDPTRFREPWREVRDALKRGQARHQAAAGRRGAAQANGRSG